MTKIQLTPFARSLMKRMDPVEGRPRNDEERMRALEQALARAAQEGSGVSSSELDAMLRLRDRKRKMMARKAKR